MQCEVQECNFATENTLTYENADAIMTRHLTVHVIEELRGLNGWKATRRDTVPPSSSAEAGTAGAHPAGTDKEKERSASAPSRKVGSQ